MSKKTASVEASTINNNKKVRNLIRTRLFPRSCKICLLKSKPYVNTKNINLYNNTDFFKCIKHLQQKHSDRYFVQTAVFKVDLTTENEHSCIIRHWNNLFFVDFEVGDSNLCVTVHRLNKNHYSGRHDRFAIEFKQNDKTLVKYGYIGLKQSFGDNVTVDTSLEGLKNVFSDIKNIVIAISVEYYAACNECHDLILFSEGKYFIKNGWFCLKCAQFTRTCTYNYMECDFTDTEEKHKKHTLFFCFYRSMCYICREGIRNENGGPGPIAHYRDKHQDITYLTELSFCVKKTNGKYCILEHNDQPMVCRYSLDENEFRFAVRTPWQHEQIKQFRCFLTMTSVKTESKTYEMQRFLDQFDDWLLVVNRFNDWTCQFDVSIKFERILDSNED